MTRLVELSHVIEDGMTTYPGLPGPIVSEYQSREQSRANYEPGTEFHIGRIDMVANTGTYLDTPFHRFAGGDDLADVPLNRVADLPGICIRTNEPEIPPASLPEVDLAGTAVLFSTGWDRHWGTDRYGEKNHPYLSSHIAERLATGGVSLVGIDSVNIDDTRGGSRPVHTALLAAGIPVVEHLTGLDVLVGVPFRFFATPPLVKGMGTFPVRAFALLNG